MRYACGQVLDVEREAVESTTGVVDQPNHVLERDTSVLAHVVQLFIHHLACTRDRLQTRDRLSWALAVLVHQPCEKVCALLNAGAGNTGERHHLHRGIADEIVTQLPVRSEERTGTAHQLFLDVQCSFRRHVHARGRHLQPSGLKRQVPGVLDQPVHALAGPGHALAHAVVGLDDAIRVFGEVTQRRTHQATNGRPLQVRAEVLLDVTDGLGELARGFRTAVQRRVQVVRVPGGVANVRDVALADEATSLAYSVSRSRRAVGQAFERLCCCVDGMGRCRAQGFRNVQVLPLHQAASGSRCLASSGSSSRIRSKSISVVLGVAGTAGCTYGTGDPGAVCGAGTGAFFASSGCPGMSGPPFSAFG